ncbi:putative amidohydrolase [Amycolatopsis bartoniae]|uniref:Hydrolase n=1 Tax=Amycolatopsis bartoniae TaxID=941986 RepID=A0A8H9IZV0_9PSEU|nr:carbon-nitrogen hydrolase family protein [Amycolatopsis bartoniae]MBB2937103.1 putative amidohydrolase [Amycolatopsis bartoniae]TVT04760.1 carbon-nitrogen hydrolase family protein [Amycolatopsis bartoniae]GHF52453.1 hydrolase [Amycolatopsis bartoniae]
MILAVAQPQLGPDLVANVAAHVDLVRRARARVVVFPELSLTGYELDADTLAPDDPRLAPLVEACAGTVALVGAPVPGDHIAMLAVDAAGARVVYRKMWLGDAERRRFRPGTRPAVLEVDGLRLGLGICKDTGVPEHAAATAALGIDVYVAGIVETEPPRDRARRIATTHHIWVAIASCANPTTASLTTASLTTASLTTASLTTAEPTTANPKAAGRSGIWRPDGSTAAEAPETTGTFVRHDVRTPACRCAASSR